MAHPLQDAFMQIPPITRAYASACVLTTLACVRRIHGSFTKLSSSLSYRFSDISALALLYNLLWGCVLSLSVSSLMGLFSRSI